MGFTSHNVCGAIEQALTAKDRHTSAAPRLFNQGYTIQGFKKTFKMFMVDVEDSECDRISMFPCLFR